MTVTFMLSWTLECVSIKMKAIQQFFHVVLCYFFYEKLFVRFCHCFTLKIAAVANSTEYRLGLIKNANMKGKFLQIKNIRDTLSYSLTWS